MPRRPETGWTRDEGEGTFANGSSSPNLDEILTAGPGPTPAFNRIAKTLRTCKSYTTSSGGQTATVHIGQLSFPNVGQSSSAYALTLSVEGINAGADLVLFRIGAVNGAIVYSDIGTPDIDQAESLIKKAVAKVHA